MNKKLLALTAVSAFALMTGLAAAQGFGVEANFQNWLPAIAIAIVIGIMIGALYYMMGSVLNNARAKAAGLGEVGQGVGTAIVVVLLLVMFNIWGQVSSALVPVGPTSGTLTPGTLYAMCQADGASQLNFLSGSPTGTVCGAVSSGIDPVDYGLVSSYVIISNLTSQAIVNLNSMYVYWGTIAFLQSVTPSFGVCTFGICYVSPLLTTSWFGMTFKPLAGYAMLDNFGRPLMAQAMLTFYSFFVQQLVILMLLYTWPWILAGGIILRATFFGRRLGGLLMAIAIGAIIFFPLMLNIEYSALSCWTGCRYAPVGYPKLSSIPDPTQNPNYGVNGFLGNPSDINFFKFADVESILQGNSCWPNGGVGLLEVQVASLYLVPAASIFSLLTSIGSGFSSTIPPIPFSICPPGTFGSSSNGLGNTPGVMSAFMSMLNAYGLQMIAGFILPLMNILITLSAIRGLSGLFGGDTDIAGIGKLV